MSAEIKSGASVDIMSVDSTSKAARVTLYNYNGSLRDRVNVNKYAAVIEVLPSTLTLGSSYFSITNTHATEKIAIDAIRMQSSFIGIESLVRSLFGIQRFSGAVPTGGVVVAGAQFDTTKPIASIDIRSAPAGLTMTGVVLGDPFHEVSVMSQLRIQAFLDLDFGLGDEEFILQPGEGVVIRAGTAIVLGAGITGSITWHRYA